LALHPTVKPLELVTDAILDVSRRGGLVLDPFAGSGTTLLAAEQTGRRACLMELDPLYCDVIVRRFAAATGMSAVDQAGQTFAARSTAALLPTAGE
jgi:DNA modification methylase